MIFVLVMLLVGGFMLVFSTHLLHRLDGEKILPFWLWSLGVMLTGFVGLAIFVPDLNAFGAVMSLAMSIFGFAGIIKTLPPL